MKEWTATVVALCVAAGLSLTSAQAPTGAPRSEEPAPSKADIAFVREAAMSGMAEVELGRLATEKASGADVKQFGQRMVDDHGKGNDELKALASRKNIDVPASLDPKHTAIRDRLAKLSGDAFDRAYTTQMVRDHNAAVLQFQRASKTARDEDIKAWAQKTLPTLQEHHKMARDLSAKERAGSKTGTGKQ